MWGSHSNATATGSASPEGKGLAAAPPARCVSGGLLNYYCVGALGSATVRYKTFDNGRVFFQEKYVAREINLFVLETRRPFN